jgi:hypothetical protein
MFNMKTGYLIICKPLANWNMKNAYASSSSKKKNNVATNVCVWTKNLIFISRIEAFILCIVFKKFTS